VTDPRKLIAEVRELDRVASKGPWHFRKDEANTFEHVCDGNPDDPSEAFVIADTFQSHEDGDGPFIARSRTILVELADALERVVKLPGEWEAAPGDCEAAVLACARELREALEGGGDG